MGKSISALSHTNVFILFVTDLSYKMRVNNYINLQRNFFVEKCCGSQWPTIVRLDGLNVILEYVYFLDSQKFAKYLLGMRKSKRIESYKMENCFLAD